MRIALYIFVIFPLGAFQFARKVPIKAGKQVDGLILLNSTVQTAISKYGRNTDFTQGIACGEHTYFTNRYSFSRQGITVITESSDDENSKTSVITNIGVSYPCNAETEEGINLVKDNLDKILKVYGKPEKTDSTKVSTVDIHYNAKGISFRCDRKKRNILKIEIYYPGTFPDFWYQ